jgi:oligopeptide transport system ATP-binding protein
MSNLNPVAKIGTQVAETLLAHGLADRSSVKGKVVEALEAAGLPDAEKRATQYPHEFSGGMRQRVMIAMALACEPDVLIADEPTTALDVTIQAQILELMQKLQKELGMAIIMITHDLGVVAQMCDEIVVMYAGSYCERGTADEIFYNPKHEYTKGLLRSIPTMSTMGQKLQPITGTPIDLLNLPKGCPFAPRCDAAMKLCIREAPDSMIINENHKASCWMNVKDAFEKGVELEVDDAVTVEHKADEPAAEATEPAAEEQPKEGGDE